MDTLSLKMGRILPSSFYLLLSTFFFLPSSFYLTSPFPSPSLNTLLTEQKALFFSNFSSFCVENCKHAQ